MARHTLMVKAYIDGEVKRPGAVVEYSGEPNWKFEPLDPFARQQCKEQVADPARVEDNLRETGDLEIQPSPAPPRADQRGYTSDMLARAEEPDRYDRYKDL